VCFAVCFSVLGLFFFFFFFFIETKLYLISKLLQLHIVEREK